MLVAIDVTSSVCFPRNVGQTPGKWAFTSARLIIKLMRKLAFLSGWGGHFPCNQVPLNEE